MVNGNMNFPTSFSWRIIILIPGLLSFLFQNVQAQCSLNVTPTMAQCLENATIGTRLYNVSISGLTPQTISLSVTRGQIPVEYDNVSALNLAIPLDYETTQQYTFTVTVQCGGPTGQASRTATVYLIVNDVDDLPPEWRPPGIKVYQATISETAIPPADVTFSPNILLLTNTENQVERLNTVIQSSNYSDYFHMSRPETYSPILQLVKTGLDYNFVQNILLTLTAFDFEKSSNILKFNSSVQVNVTIKDEDNHGPVFAYSSYTGTMLSNATAGTPVSMLPDTIRAYDGDIYINTPIGYSLEDSDGGNFVINSATGVISTRVDYPTPRVYRLAVKAYQLNNPSQMFANLFGVAITVMSIYGNPPKCSSEPYVVTVREDVAVNTVIQTIQVQTDTSLRMQYMLITSSSAFSLQQIGNSSSASLIVLQVLSYSKQSRYSLQFQATIPGAVTTCNILVIVNQVSNEPPVFVSSTSSVVTIRKKGLIVYQAMATSSDQNATFIYILQDSTNCFTINQSTGVVSIAVEPSQLTQSSYSLVITARNSEIPTISSQKIITITFNDTVPRNDTTPVLTVGPIIGIAVALAVVLIAAIITIVLCYVKMKRQAEVKRAPSHFGESTYSYTDRWANDLPISGEPLNEKINEMYYGDHEVQEVYNADLAQPSFSYGQNSSSNLNPELPNYSFKPSLDPGSQNIPVTNNVGASMTIYY